MEHKALTPISGGLASSFIHPYVSITFICDALLCFAFSALMLLVGWQEGHPACKKTEWWGAGVVVCLEQGADLRMSQLMPLLLPLTVSCFCKIQIGFTFLVPAHTHTGSPGKWPFNGCVWCFLLCLEVEARRTRGITSCIQA